MAHGRQDLAASVLRSGDPCTQLSPDNVVPQGARRAAFAVRPQPLRVFVNVALRMGGARALFFARYWTHAIDGAKRQHAIRRRCKLMRDETPITVRHGRVTTSSTDKTL